MKNIKNGDIIYKISGAKVALYKYNEATGRGELLAQSATWRRKRYLYKSGSESIEAPQFTPRAIDDKEQAPAIIGHYLPELDGRNVWKAGYYWEEDPRYTIKKGQKLNSKRTAKPAEVLPAEHRTIVPGAILYCSWGYDQTNIDYYLVTKRTNAFATIVQIGYKTHIETDYLQGTCTPDPEKITGKPIRRKVQVSNGREIGLFPQSFSWAKLWSGNPDHWTAYA